MVTLCENIILWDLLYCFRISIFDAVSQFNDSAHKREVSYLLKKLEQLKHSWNTKSAAVNNIKLPQNTRSNAKCRNH